MKDKEKVSIFWFRRDLRLEDNCGLYHALKSDYPVVPIFIFDKNILDELKDPKDARVSFIHEQISEINHQLKGKNSRIITFHNQPEKAFQQLLVHFDIQAVYTNRDYEPYAKERDGSIQKCLQENKIEFLTFKDQVIFESEEILKADGTPYLVYTPFSKKWLAELKKEHLEAYTSGLLFENWATLKFKDIISLEEMGFQPSKIRIPAKQLSDHTLRVYEAERNFPDKDSTSRLGVHLRFGTVSIRKVAKQAQGISLTYLKELIWREFFMMILYHYPKVVENNFNSKYDWIKWRNDEKDFEKWCAGKTGFPLVDAGMRELNETGFMHNRVRMLVASFLTKHLLINWKWGEAYFAEKLLDYELASNNGNWQWAAGTGVDAAPYFRIFNPESQIEKFDQQHIYIKRWVKEYGSSSYPKPMVEHKKARERALETYKAGII
tara:strand:+ start:31772 stop:33079 length:1308 start_codon:yes stop_codon:yes gene_type:complete